MKRNKLETRNKLINATIQVIGTLGIDKATTKKISETAGGINEAYIYRFFDSKENLYHTAFQSITKQINYQLSKTAPLLQQNLISNQDRWWLFVSEFWRYAAQHKEMCMCYLRYYYSPYYRKLSVNEHKISYQSVLDAIKPTFRESVDIELIFHYIFITVLSFAVKDNEKLNETNAAEMSRSIYELIYAAIEPHLIKNKAISNTEKEVTNDVQ